MPWLVFGRAYIDLAQRSATFRFLDSFLSNSKGIPRFFAFFRSFSSIYCSWKALLVAIVGFLRQSGSRSSLKSSSTLYTRPFFDSASIRAIHCVIESLPQRKALYRSLSMCSKANYTLLNSESLSLMSYRLFTALSKFILGANMPSSLSKSC